jgi:3-phenylpropionate/trans-cinnamate dioxygenase ferredoxin reductase subunit
MKKTYVIAGAGLAGASAAAALRTGGFDGRVLLLGEERERPYERPELSKKYLRGEPDVDLAVHDAEFYAANEIELTTGRQAERIDLGTRQVGLADGGSLAYDKLLLATGAAPRTLDVPGAELDGVLTLRTKADADAIRERSMAAAAIVVVGGGWIGSEVAASLRELGRDVTLVLPTQAPLERVLGPEVAAVYRAAHEEHGVRLVTRTTVTKLHGRGRVASVVTSDGQTLPAELVVVGVGADPRSRLAADAGLAVGGGILVDERLQTADAAVFAAGDVANTLHPIYGRLRVEHWDNAKWQGRAAARSMLGGDRAYDRIPYFYSDQYDLGMEYTGLAPAWDDVVFRGDPASREFIAFWLRDGRVVAGMNMNVWDVADQIEHLVRGGLAVDRALLADVGRPLVDLASAA